LAQKYNVSSEELIALNPELEAGLKTGMKLKIPAKTNEQQATPANDKQNYSKYNIESGETLFSLANRFGVDVADIKQANPSLFSRSLEAGEIILIPQQTSLSNEKQASDSNLMDINGKSGSKNNPCKQLPGKNNQKYKVALLLPFYISENEQSNGLNAGKPQRINFNNQSLSVVVDSTNVVVGANIDQKAIGFIEFYEGAIIALDSLKRMGMNCEMFVYDASSQQKVNDIVRQNELLDMNLIIGPVLPEHQESVASFAEKNKIPLISPLSNSGSFEQNNPYYIKVNPGRDYLIEQSAEYIESEFSDKNFIVIQIPGNTASPETKLAQLCKESLSGKSSGKLFHEYNFQMQGVQQIKSILDETKENVFLIPTDNEAKASIAITNITALAEHYNIVLMATPTLVKMKSLQTENFHRIRLRYLSPYFIDYNTPLVKRFVAQYRDLFTAEPTQFSFQGFDVTYYFLSALYNYGRDFRSCMVEYPMKLTQMDFNFRKVNPDGGYMNHSLFISSYERNFDVLNLGVVGRK